MLGYFLQGLYNTNITVKCQFFYGKHVDFISVLVSGIASFFHEIYLFRNIFGNNPYADESKSNYSQFINNSLQINVVEIDPTVGKKEHLRCDNSLVQNQLRELALSERASVSGLALSGVLTRFSEHRRFSVLVPKIVGTETGFGLQEKIWKNVELCGNQVTCKKEE